MRLIIDSLIAAMLAAILGAVLLHYRQAQEELRKCQKVHQALTRLQDRVMYRSALGDVPLNGHGFPHDISLLWFPEGVPYNALAMGYPWLDVAPPGDMSDHPPDPMLTSPGQCGLWYNPGRGLFRARVPRQFTEEATLELYNRLNGTLLRRLPVARDAPRPLPLQASASQPAPTPASQPMARELGSSTLTSPHGKTLITLHDAPQAP